MTLRTFRLDFSSAKSLGKIKQTGDGGLRIPAKLSRTGILDYTYQDGSASAEFRSPEEVFSQDSLDSFRSVTVTKGHPALGVSPDNWKQLAVGHVAEDVRADGNFVAATIVIKDPETVADILAGDLMELSCGYTCKVEPATGEHDGRKFDNVQREIRGNHVALGPKDWGRAGNDVRLYLDSHLAEAKGPEAKGYTVFDATETGAPKELTMTVKTKTDNTEGEAIATPATPAPEKVVPLALYEQTLAERDAAKAELATAKTKEAETAKAFDSAVEKRVNLLEKSKAFLPTDYVFTGKADSQIMADCVASVDTSFKADGKGDGYLEARFDLLKAPDAGEASRANVNAIADKATTPEVKSDARTKMIERNKDAWKTSFPEAK